MTDAYVERRRVDDTGTITGLDPARGRDILLIRLPDLDEVQRQAEADAERIARDLNWDPEKARGLVRGTADGARSLAEAAERAWNRLTSPLDVAKEEREEKEALRDVARAARRGDADWTATPSGPAAVGGPGQDLTSPP